jgi:soluble lytic murein transglycosylase-like protein
MIGRRLRIPTVLSFAVLWLLAMPIRAAPTATAAAPPIRFQGTLWEQAARREGIAPALLYALALARTGRTGADGTAAPWPWTVVADGKPQHFARRAQAAAALAQLGPRAAPSVGLAGIPPRPGAAAAELLDPATNLRLAAADLARRLRERPQDPALALGRLAYPSDPVAARTLGRRVLAIAAALDPGAARAHTAVAIRTHANAPTETGAAAPVAGLIRAAALRHGVDPAFALAIASAESRFRQNAVSPKGARGVMQLMPGTAARYRADPHDLGQNIDTGVRYLRDLAELFDGDPVLVAAGYNAGEGAVLKHGRRVPPYPETQRYVPRVLAARERYR